MEIVSQFPSVSYSPFPALPAPRIAGLLPARCGCRATPPVAVVVKKRESLLDRRRAMWAAQDAELEAFLDGARQRLAAVYAEICQERSARPFIWEMAS